MAEKKTHPTKAVLSWFNLAYQYFLLSSATAGHSLPTPSIHDHSKEWPAVAEERRKSWFASLNHDRIASVGWTEQGGPHIKNNLYQQLRHRLPAPAGELYVVTLIAMQLSVNRPTRRSPARPKISSPPLRSIDLETVVPYVCFALCRSKLSAECSQPKINFFFNRIDPLETSPCELSSAVKKNE